MSTAVERLIDAIGYPDRAPGGASSFTLRVDGAEVVADERDGRMVLSCALGDDESMLPALAEYAAGRMLKEDAVFACDDGGRAMLWQDAPASADQRSLRRLFESFMDSCDWWRARVDALRVAGAAAPEPDMAVIMP